MTRAEQVTGPDAYHGEGPCWWDDWGGLRYVDMLAGDVLALDPASGTVTRTHVDDEVAAVIRPRRSGGAVLALRDRFVVTDGPLDELRTIATVSLADGVRLNEGGCDPDGRFYCGSMAYDETAGAGTFYCIDKSAEMSVVIDKVTISNGFDFSPDDTIGYYIDTPRQSIDAFDYGADAGLTNRRRWVDIPADAGGPDGLVVDAEGGVWVALFGGAAVHRYAPDGRLDAVVELPVRSVTACTFGGDRLQTLYITTSQIRADLDAEPAAGALFAIDPGVTGLASRGFAG
jgi:sugar lactone lactonase YvrE